MPPMLILALETSTEAGSCALWQDGALIGRVCPTGRPHSETLLPLVRELLAEAAVPLSRLDALAFGVGPGAFTGLRVACGAAQGLAVGADLPVVPVVSLACLAHASGAAQVLALLDARMGEVYAARYRLAGGLPVLDGEITVGAPADIALPDSSWRIAGNACAAYPALAERIAAAGLAADPASVPQAATVAALGAAAFAAGGGIDPALAAPLYVRDKVAKTVAERLAEGGRA